MKKVIILSLLVLFTSSKCTHEPKVLPASEQIMYYEVDKNFDGYQIDSACVAEKISNRREDWIDGSVIIDYLTEKQVPQWVYIQNDSTIYIITDLDTILNFKKRVVRTKNK